MQLTRYIELDGARVLAAFREAPVHFNRAQVVRFALRQFSAETAAESSTT